MPQENQMLGWIVAIVAFALIIGLVLWFIYRKNNPKVPKTQGREYGVAKAVAMAQRFARGNDYKVIAPATLMRAGNTARLDALVVGSFGVLGVKALGYSGEVYGSAGEDTWVQVAPDGKRNPFKNPLTEAAADVRVIRDALFSAKQKLVPVEVVCVFTDTTASIAVPRSTGHYTMRTFKELLGKEKYREDKGVNIALAQEALREALTEGLQ